MSEYPIENLMKNAMNSIKDMIDVNTIVGEPIETTTNIVIIPISKVCFGFAAGGTEFDKKEKDDSKIKELPFGGGSGAAVNIIPVGFIIIDSENLGAPKFVTVQHSDAIDKLLDYVPDLMEKANKIIDKVVKQRKSNEQENSETEKEYKNNKGTAGIEKLFNKKSVATESIEEIVEEE